MKFTFSSYIIFVSASLLIAPMIAFGIDPTTSGRILDTFKEQHEEILFESSPVSLSGSNDLLVHEYAMNGLDSLKKKLELVSKGYQMKKEIVSERRKSLEETLSFLDQAINTSARDIQDLQTQIRDKEARINELQSLSVALKKKVEEHRAIILSYMANVYNEGNLLFDSGDNMDIVKNLLLSDSQTDTSLTDMTYTTLVSELGQKFVNDYRTLVRQYYLLSVDLDDQVLRLSGLKQKLVLRIENIATQKLEREKLLEITKGQEAKYEEYINAQIQAENTVSEAWKIAEAKYNGALDELLEKNGCEVKKNALSPEKKEKCAELRKYFEGEKYLKSTEFTTAPNILTWPVTSDRITTFFRDPDYYALFRSQHDAIDIAVAQSSDVVAAFDGYVHYVLPPADGGYSYVVLKHRDGYMTVYGHLSEVLVDRYAIVKKGDIIAKSGGAPGTPGAGPMTTGAHLHFEVWKDKEPVDPLRYLSLADFAFENLPSRYEDKFISDIIERTGTGTNVDQYQKKFVIRGENEAERQRYLLEKYATPDFRSWNLWVDTAIDAEIDPSFLMCVGLAETTLGNHLKTAYNIGNIGNTDSGDVTVFDSPGEGLYWMGKTFNNKYLGKYTKLSELSRWGNEDGTIYASSNANWHNNIVKCVSALKGRFIEDDFRFRTVQK